MRDIKFRGKCLRTNDWVYGSLIIKRNEYYISYISDISGIWSVIQVEPKTVGQYTGLKDKNGKEIYEGDIVQQNYKDMYNETRSLVGEVVYADCVYWLKIGSEYTFLYDECQIDESVVIGNIYENPELLDT